MAKMIPKRITYAQRFLLELINERKLKEYCETNGLQHVLLFKIAYGEIRPTYKVMSATCHLIPVIDWLFWTDEEKPYPAVFLPCWESSGICTYIMRHSEDYRTEGAKYGLSELSSYNLFIRHKAKPDVGYMRRACKENDPADFFRADYKDNEGYEPSRGDIINMGGRIFFVASVLEGRNKLILCPVTAKSGGEEDPVLSGMKTTGYVSPEPETMEKSSKLFYIETTTDEIKDKIMEKLRGNFE